MPSGYKSFSSPLTRSETRRRSLRSTSAPSIRVFSRFTATWLPRSAPPRNSRSTSRSARAAKAIRSITARSCTSSTPRGACACWCAKIASARTSRTTCAPCCGSLLVSVSHADRAAIDDHDAVYHAFGMLQVGLRQNHRHALELEPADHLRQPLRQCWRHTLERLVEQQQLVAAHQRAADRHHLLLASRNLRSLAQREAAQLRDQPVDLLQTLG